MTLLCRADDCEAEFFTALGREYHALREHPGRVALPDGRAGGV